MLSLIWEIKIDAGQQSDDGIVHRHQPTDDQSDRNGKRDGYLTLNLRDGSVGVVAYAAGQVRFNYMMVTHPDGKMEKVNLKHYAELLQ